MRLILLVTLTMVAFAANSVLNRMALTDAGMGPAAFAAMRLAAGAAVLMALAVGQGARPLRGASWRNALWLLIYMLGFSFAYITLDAGVGALVLFGGVQVTMFAGAVLAREPIGPARWGGAVISFAGLAYLLWPSDAVAVDLGGKGLMLLAALGWGLFSLAGRGSGAPLVHTAAAFTLALPAALIVFLMVRDAVTLSGVLLAIVSGAATSGLGYALWYRVLPDLGASRAAVVQLTVPLIAMAGSLVLLSEPLTWRFVIAAGLVLGGVGLSLRRS